ncbi:prenyltransferase/squalene oxidase repeat-containing protein [Streptomyces melanogenes]|uniref:prenyltransferase/squalene oxidase repeat-containing protein n=1 Tax=Streptomyces melanogenes TaxID=67326 RepID=UPI001E516F63|nr:prenyltransferase/squalene oxidase repeat-containing protein [Streptomyces melanogenes]
MGTTERTDRRTGTRGLLSLVTAALLTLAGGAAFLSGTAPAAADPIEKCTATTGAVVAVDFGPFGGKVERGCDATPTNGYDLLHEAGFTTEGTQHDGPAFICRLGFGSFDSGTKYPTPDKEDCVLTPQATAYWSYWTASPGQDTWTYSAYGAMDRKPKAGDVDAWVFGGTDVGGTTGRPAFTPDQVRASGGGDTDPTVPTVPAGHVDVAAAAKWLTGRLSDGERVVGDSGTPDHFLTAEAAFALAAANGKGPGLDKVTAFLAKNTDAYAYPAGKTGAPDAGAAARLALLAEATEGDPHAFGGHDLVGDLVKHLCQAGPSSGTPTPGCTAKGDFPNAGYAEGQSLALLAVARAGTTPPPAAVTRLTQLQCPQGGFTSILIGPGENCDPDPATTGLAVLALGKAGGQDAVVAKARTYLKKAQRSDGGFPGYTDSPTASPFATAYAAQALRTLGDTARADAAVSWLSRQQLPDGGFGFDEGATDAAVYPTVPAVLAGRGTSLATLTTKKPEPTQPPTTPTTPTKPPTIPPGEGPDLRKGVAYLTRGTNLLQGAYYSAGGGTGRADFGLTIDGAYALAATGLDNNKLRGIVDFLDKRGKDGAGRTVDDWTSVGTKYAAGGSIGKTALLAEAVGRDPRALGGHDLIAALAKAVCTAPSKAPDRRCAAKGNYTYAPAVFAQSLGVMAQLRAGEKDAAQEPLAYLKSLQQSSGAWPSIIPSTGDSDVDSTAMAAMTLDLAGDAASRAAVDKALAWIATRQLPDGGFPGAAGDSVNSAALAVQGLSLDSAKYSAQISRARKFLASQQNGDGGFNIAKEGQRGSDLRASTQAVGGATGISFARLTRDLSGTTAQPTPTPPSSTGAPTIITPGETGTGRSGGGRLASTGVQAGALAISAALLVLGGWVVTATARKRRTTVGGHR